MKYDNWRHRKDQNGWFKLPNCKFSPFHVSWAESRSVVVFSAVAAARNSIRKKIRVKRKRRIRGRKREERGKKNDEEEKEKEEMRGRVEQKEKIEVKESGTKGEHERLTTRQKGREKGSGRRKGSTGGHQPGIKIVEFSFSYSLIQRGCTLIPLIDPRAIYYIECIETK